MARTWGELLGDGHGERETDEQERGLFGRLRESLSRSRQALTAELAAATFDPGNAADWERLEEALIAGAAAFADPRLDLALAQRARKRGGVVAAVGPQLVGSDPARRERVNQRQQVASLVFVAGSEPHLKRCALRVYGEVVATSGTAAERARDLLAPFLASTSDASTITRDQSSLSEPARSVCNTTSARSSNPRPAHSSSRRRHVSPLGNPSSR